MLYRHKVTGAVIDVESTMGGDWQAVKPASTTRAADQEAEKPTPEKAVKKNGRTVRKRD